MNKLYLNVYEKQRAFYENRPKMKKALYFADKIATWAIAVIYAAMCAYITFRRPDYIDPDKNGASFTIYLDAKDFFRTIVLPLLSFAAVSLLRYLFDEKRPYEREITPLYEKKTIGRSFPSRHLSCAATAAFIAFCYFTPAGIIITICGAVLFYTRFACGWHFPRDLFAGAIIGCLCAFAGLSVV